VPHEGDVGEAQIGQEIVDVLGESRNRITVVRLVGLAVSSHIDRDDAIAVAEPAQLVLELGGRL
jgi:hypothetical protein